jgi:hypothetical protein
MHAYEAGTLAAAGRLGLLKHASGATYMGPDGVQLPFWQSVGAHSKRWLLGKPSEFWQELKSGTAYGPGTYSRSALWPTTPLAPDAGLGARIMSKAFPALLYAPAALQLVGAAATPEEHRGEAVGAALGGALGLAAGMPLGILGSSATNLAGSALGGRIGKLFDPTPAPLEFDYAPARK